VGQNRGNCFYMCLYRGHILKDLLKNQWAQRACIYVKVFRHSTNESVLKLTSLGSDGATVIS
jgi:hypothetical protein